MKISFHLYITICAVLFLFALAACNSRIDTKPLAMPLKIDSVKICKPVSDSIVASFVFDSNMYIPRRKPNWRRWVKYRVVYGPIVTRYADTCNIKRELVEAIITWESNWTAGGTNASNCSGLMQVMGGSHNPAKNVRSGCKIYSRYRSLMNAWFIKKYGIELSPTDLAKVALTAYNRGCGGAHKYYRKHISIVGSNYKIQHSSYANSVWWVYFQILKKAK